MRVPAGVCGTARRAPALGLALVLLVAACRPALAADVNVAAVCVTTMTVTFTDKPLGAVPDTAVDHFTMSGSGTCSGPSPGPISLAGSGMALPGTSCAAPLGVATGTGTVTPPSMTAIPVTIAAAGAVVQLWTLSNTAPPVAAVGVFAWLATAEITACALSGISTITLTGVLVVASG